MAEVKRIALFLDGTWNNVQDNTNVWRLKCLCLQTPEQLVYYSAGVGTQSGEHLSGGMFGIGINQEVTSAYEWLLEHYEPDAQIFIFGFSRGAFTARSLAGFISKCGLLKPGSPVSLKQLYERYRKGTAQSVRALGRVASTELSQEDQWIKEYSRAIPIWFQGVWDTVGALGVPLPCMPKVSRADFCIPRDGSEDQLTRTHIMRWRLTSTVRHLRPPSGQRLHPRLAIRTRLAPSIRWNSAGLWAHTRMSVVAMRTIYSLRSP